MKFERSIPDGLYYACTASSCFALLISLFTITRQLQNYRKPQEQRMIIRILLMVPIFCVTCWLSACLLPTNVSKLWLGPIQELYESFIIYTFFSYLVMILGGERKILMELGWGKPLIRHPFLGRVLSPVDISDPKDFLSIKRGVLQYVWFKPFYILGKFVVELAPKDSVTGDLRGWCAKLDTLLLIGYNVSASLSLYELALFWRCLYKDLAKYKPWPKFLCVKLIIFASYWQGILLLILNRFGVLKETEEGQDMGFIYQNVFLCIEMVGFSLGHLVAFSTESYDFKHLPSASRVKFSYALRDCFGSRDLINDFKTTLFGTQYSYRNFDYAEAALTRNANIRTRDARMNEGLRLSNNGTSQYWVQQPVNYGSMETADNESIRTSSSNGAPLSNFEQQDALRQHTEENVEEGTWTEFLDGLNLSYIPDDPNYPVVYDIEGHKYRPSVQKLRKDFRAADSV